ncbi:replication initiation protein [Cetobacterium sp. 8H]|uniref:replication initiation protein n=1 Tax=Cetobacterium sp. 8H TaxID=2759681 RepID=UPI00163BFFE4|nr:replication initiation protein [Cetobacterium sp. 8H]MBC2850998.1 replication initiation protein [Cetobacterium sp. 8H]
MKKMTFDFSKNDIFIDTDKKLNKKERDFLEIIRDKYKGKNEKYIIFTEKELRSIVKERGSIEDFLDKFSKRRIHLKLIEKNEEIFFASFSIFDFYMKNRDEYRVYISRSLKSLKESGIFDDIDLLLILLFKEKKSFQLYLALIKNRMNGGFVLTRDQLKELLGVGQENYERFYDFEKTILRPALDDINELTKYSVDYKKIKNSEGFTSKIMEIEFIFNHKLSPIIAGEIDSLLLPLRDRVDSIAKVSKIIEEALLKEGIDFVRNNLYHLDKGISGSLDEAISLALKENSNIESQERYILINKTTDIFSNRFIFESRLYKELLKCKFYYNYNFLKTLRNMKVGELLQYKDERHKIEILYADKGRESTIEIYKIAENATQEKK